MLRRRRSVQSRDGWAWTHDGLVNVVILIRLVVRRVTLLHVMILLWLASRLTLIQERGIIIGRFCASFILRRISIRILPVWLSHARSYRLLLLSLRCSSLAFHIHRCIFVKVFTPRCRRYNVILVLWVVKHRERAVPKERGLTIFYIACLHIVFLIAVFLEILMEPTVLHFFECMIVHASDVDNRDDIT